MSDENNESTANLEELQAQLAEAQKERESLLAKNEELLSETKKAKQARKEAEAAAAAEAERIAKEKGDFEQLHKSSEERYQNTIKELEALRSTVANKEITNAAMRLSVELADGSNAELLSEFIARRLKFTDDGLKVTNSKGELTVSSLDDLKNEFRNDARYSALLKGNQSSGGGAAGGSNGGGAAKTMTRAEFESKNPKDQMTFVRSGGTVTD